MYRFLLGLLATLAVAFTLAGLSFSASSQERADVRYIAGTEPETLDPHQLTGQTGGRIVSALFEGLTRKEAKSLESAPGVAKSWDISEDGRRYTFHLREDSRWSDGVKVGAADFIYSFRRLLDPAFGAEYAYLLHPVKGARALNLFAALAEAIETKLVPALGEELARSEPRGLPKAAWQALTTRLPLHDSLQYCEDLRVRDLLDHAPAEPFVARQALEHLLGAMRREAERLRAEAQDAGSRFGQSLGIYAENEHTLVIELDAPTPYFLDIISFYPTLPAPRHVIEKHGDSWFLPGNVVSNGPFLLSSWRVNDRIRLRRNEDYWGRAEVRAETIDALSTESATTALNQFLTGEAEWLPSWYPRDLVDALRQRPDFYSHAAFTVYYYRINTERPPLHDPRVRQALNLAIDRRLITEQVTGLGELPAAHFVPPGVPGYVPPESSIRLDPERARALLAEAGFPGGKGFPPLGILYNTFESHRKIAEVVAHQLERELGIEVVPYNQEWQSYIATTRARDYQLGRASWIGDYADPNTFLDMWVTNGGNNQTGFSSPTYDALIRAAANIEALSVRPEALLSKLKQPEIVRQLLDERAASPDPARRRALLDAARMRLLSEAEAILVQDEFPIIPIYVAVNSGLRAPGLRGLHTELELGDGTRVPNLQDIYPLRDLWFDARAE